MNILEKIALVDKYNASFKVLKNDLENGFIPKRVNQDIIFFRACGKKISINVIVPDFGRY